jgi:hypothetical protein
MSAYREAAKGAGLSVAEWMRRTLDAGAGHVEPEPVDGRPAPIPHRDGLEEARAAVATMSARDVRRVLASGKVSPALRDAYEARAAELG